MYYFDTEKRNGIDKEDIKNSCPKNMHVHTTDITDSGEIAELTEKQNLTA